MKRCSKCKELKDKSEFRKNRSRKDGLSVWCKKCLRHYARKNLKPLTRYLRYEESHRTIDGMKQKRCNKCKKWKDESKFGKRRYRSKDGLNYFCTDCDRTRRLKRYKKEGEDMKRYYRYEECHRVVDGMKQKRCCRCKKWKAENQYYKHTGQKDGLQYWCKACADKATNAAHKKRLAIRN